MDPHQIGLGRITERADKVPGPGYNRIKRNTMFPAVQPGHEDKGVDVQYLTMQESVRRLRAAGLNARPQTVREWIREQKVQDVLILGRHLFIYEAELEALISSHRTA